MLDEQKFACNVFFVILYRKIQFRSKTPELYSIYWGALIFRAEIIPFEPARVIPRREEEAIIRFFQALTTKHFNY